jgi:two-component system response regulator YesN
MPVRFRLLIVEDEDRVLEGLNQFIMSLDLPLEIFTAHDGIEAVTLAEEMPPDIIITDIEMPKLDGLEFLKAIHSSLPQVQKIILTGHEKFSYAQKAISLDVAEYLTKPINRPRLAELIKKACDNTTERRKNAQNQKIIKTCVRQHLLCDIIRYGPESLRESQDFSELPEFSPYMMAAIRCKEGESRDLLPFFEQAFQELFNPDPGHVFARYTPSLFVLYIQAAAKTDLPKNLTRFADLLLNTGGLHLSLGMSRAYQNPGSIGQAWQEAVQAQDYFIKKEQASEHAAALIARAKEFISANLKDATLETVAETVQLTPAYFSMLFQEKTGEHFKDYIAVKKMETARKMLADPHVKPSHVSRQLGYTDYKYFAKLFRHFTGLSPGQYQRSGN